MGKKQSISLKTKNKYILIFKKIWRYRFVILLGGIFLLHLFFRVYELETRAVFAWDQVDNAWYAKNILVEKQYPLLGMVAKQNNFNIGPGYYYLVAAFYKLTDLDPIASPLLATVSSVVSFFVLFFIGSKLFGRTTAYIACFLYAVSFYGIIYDRIQWPVQLIPAISLLIFYLLFQVIKGKHVYFLFLGAAIGVSLHIHFTSIFYPIFVFFTLPLISWNRKMMIHGIASLGIIVLFLLPNLVAQFLAKNNQGGKIFAFFENNYHGVHLRRVIQIAPDALSEFQGFARYTPSITRYFYVPFFVFLFLKDSLSKDKKVIVFLLILWFLLPWIAFSTYRGELTNYYFSLTKFQALLMISFTVSYIFARNIITKLGIIIVLALYGYFNIQDYLHFRNPQSLEYYKEKVKAELDRGEGNEFLYGAPESYLHYYYKEYKGKWR